MKLDDEVCLCFHVTRRKVHQYIRVKHPEVASQLSECFGAGTGCGWCRPYLERIFRGETSQSETSQSDSFGECELPEATEYAQSRGIYRARKMIPRSDP
jgi:bacterioferritin-associated ferredoxin